MMAREEALAEARKRWGENAEALTIIDTIGTFTGLGVTFKACTGEPGFEIMGMAKAHFSVGVWVHAPGTMGKFETKGQGGSWEEALADADARQEPEGGTR